ncbi:MAG TPA: class I SAM-dependent methyltransferase [Polyangiaceae bacterium]|jgi:SAM-dependent methyltransferase
MAQPSTESSTEARWGSAAVDPRGFNLPALKAKYLLSRLPESGKVLEVGSGDGKMLRTVLRELPALSVFGCDVRDSHLRPEAAEFRVMNGVQIPFDDETFDAVFVADVLEHVPDPEFVLAEIARVLKPHGRFVGFVPLEGEPRSAYEFYRRLLGPDLYLRTKHHVQSYRHSDVRRLLEAHFELADERFAYHALGHALDASFFALASLGRIERFWWRENKYYTDESTPEGPLAFALNRLLELGNALAYFESRALEHSSFAAAGILFDARRARSATKL